MLVGLAVGQMRGHLAWTRSVSSEREKGGLKDTCEVEWAGLDGRLYLRDRETEGSKEGSQVLGWRC